jgi:hypothetical protein
MDDYQANQGGQERIQQLGVLEITLAAVVAALLLEGFFALWSSMVAATLLLGLLAYDAQQDRTKLQSAVFATLFALCTILTVGFLFNWVWQVLGQFLGGAITVELWQELSYVCKRGTIGTELAGFNNVPENAYVCQEDSPEELTQTLLPDSTGGDFAFAAFFIVVSWGVYRYRQKRYYRPLDQQAPPPAEQP